MEGLKSILPQLPVVSKDISDKADETQLDEPRRSSLHDSPEVTSSNPSQSSWSKRKQDAGEPSPSYQRLASFIARPSRVGLSPVPGHRLTIQSVVDKDGVLPVLDGLKDLVRIKDETTKNREENNASVDRVLQKMSLSEPVDVEQSRKSKADDQALSLPSITRQRGGLGSRGRLDSSRGMRNQSLFRDISSAGSVGSKGSRSGSGSARRPFSKNARRVRQDQAVPAFFNPAHILQNCSLFKNCSIGFIRSLQELSGTTGRSGKMLEPRTSIVTEGTLGESMFIIHRGQCQMTQGSTVLQVLGPGDFFGERVLLGLEPRHTVGVRSLTLCQLFEVSCIAFMQTLMRHPIERHQFERGPDQSGKQVQAGSKPQRKRQVSDVGDLVGSTASSPRSHVSLSSEGGRSSQGCSVLSAGRGGNVSFSRARQSVAVHHQSITVPVTVRELRLASDSPRGHGEKRSTNKSDSQDSTNQVQSATGTKRYGSSMVDVRGTEAEDESFVERVKRSLKVDVHRGFKMPGNSCLEAYSENIMEQRPCSTASHSSGGTKRIPDDHRIEIGLLPPLSTMTPLQKKGLQRQLEDRLMVRKRLRQAAKRFTVLRKVGFAGALKLGDLAAQMQEKSAGATSSGGTEQLKPLQ